MTKSHDLLEPQIRRFLDELTAAASAYPDPTTVPIAEARRDANSVRTFWARGGPIMARTADVVVPTRYGGTRLRLYYPDPGSRSGRPALIYLHGGGWTLFGLESHDRIMREYAAAADVVVIGVDYPLAPESKFPQPLETCVDVVRWLAEHEHHLGIDAGRLAIGGDSSGANLALAACLMLRDSGTPLLCAGLLLYGVYDTSLKRRSYADYGDGRYLLSTRRMQWFWSNYLAKERDRSHPYAAPLRADLRDLPPLHLTIAELDILRDENVLLLEKARGAGSCVEAKIYPGTIHAFVEACGIADVARQAIADGATFLRRHVGAAMTASGRRRGCVFTTEAPRTPRDTNR